MTLVKKFRLKNVNIEEISVCPEPAQEGASIDIVKSKEVIKKANYESYIHKDDEAELIKELKAKKLRLATKGESGNSYTYFDRNDEKRSAWITDIAKAKSIDAIDQSSQSKREGGLSLSYSEKLSSIINKLNLDDIKYDPSKHNNLQGIKDIIDTLRDTLSIYSSGGEITPQDKKDMKLMNEAIKVADQINKIKKANESQESEIVIDTINQLSQSDIAKANSGMIWKKIIGRLWPEADLDGAAMPIELPTAESISKWMNSNIPDEEFQSMAKIKAAVSAEIFNGLVRKTVVKKFTVGIKLKKSTVPSTLLKKLDDLIDKTGINENVQNPSEMFDAVRDGNEVELKNLIKYLTEEHNQDEDDNYDDTQKKYMKDAIKVANEIRTILKKSAPMLEEDSENEEDPKEEGDDPKEEIEMKLLKTAMNLSEDQRAHAMALNEIQLQKFLELSDAERESTAKPIYKSRKGITFTKAHDPIIIEMARELDATQASAKIEKSRNAELSLHLRADTELNFLPGSVQARAAILKSVEDESDDVLKKDMYAVLKAANESLAKSFSFQGKRPKSGSIETSPESRIDAIANKYAADKNISISKAKVAISDLPEVKDLYNQIPVRAI